MSLMGVIDTTKKGHAKNPLNHYAQSKLAGEKIL